MTYYNAVKPLNIKPLYSANDIVDFTIKLRPGRAVKAGTLRVSGYLNIQKQAPGSSNWIPCTKADSVFVSPYAGVHSFFRNSACSVNDRILEQNSMLPRWASMVKQSKLTLEGINTSSMATLELCGTQNNVALLGSEVYAQTVTLPNVVGEIFSIPFSFHPEVALNKSSADLGESRFPQMKILFNMCSAIEALYSTAHPDYIEANISALQYSFLDLQLNWYETVEVPSREPVTFQTVSLITQTLISSNATFAVNSPTLYDAISMSFIKQAHRNKLEFDNYACEYIPGIENIGSRVEATVSGNDQPVRFPIQSYGELSLNFWKSMAGDVKNSIMNTYSSQNGCFGIGYRFTTGINDRLSVNMILNGLSNNQNPSSANNASDVFIYVSGFTSV